MQRYSASGRLEQIVLRPKKRAATIDVQKAELITNHGIEGDHRTQKQAASKRQVTLIQYEHLDVIAALSKNETPLDARSLRRNLVVSGVNIYTLRKQHFKVGDCELEGTGLCDPCSFMEEILGHGGFNAMRGHGGITAKIINGGTISVGDSIKPINDELLISK